MPEEKKNNRALLTALLLSSLMILALMMVGEKFSKERNLSYSDAMQMVRDGKVAELTIKGQEISIRDANNKRYSTTGPEDTTVLQNLLAEENVTYGFEQEPKGGMFQTLFPILSLGLAGFLIWMVFRQMQGASGRALSFGKSRAKMLDENSKRVTFDDVAGLDEAKEELTEIVDFLKDPTKYTRLGGRIPKGVLMIGPPGTGKTLLAKAVAGEADVPFFSISGSDFVEMFVGVGASRVRDLFEQGKKNAPCLIFIDEIDAVGRKRGTGMGGGNDEREQTLNQLLVEMDGFEGSDTVILLAATNRPGVLDNALLRPGRFDRRVVVTKPDVKGREQILEVHTVNTPLNENVDLALIAKGTPGFSGADLRNLVNEAALIAARHNKTQLEMSDFEESKDKVSMGSERRSMVIPEKERRRTAFHEAGHAIVARALPEADTVHKVTIVPRGQALGVTQMFPDEDRLGATAQQLETRLAVYMGGRAAEELVFNEITTGAHNDLQQATRIARAMVTEYGMSDEIGPMNLSTEEATFAVPKPHSEAISQLVDNEVRRLLEEAYQRATHILQANHNLLTRIAEALLEKETIDRQDFDQLSTDIVPV